MTAKGTAPDVVTETSGLQILAVLLRCGQHRVVTLEICRAQRATNPIASPRRMWRAGINATLAQINQRGVDIEAQIRLEE